MVDKVSNTDQTENWAEPRPTLDQNEIQRIMEYDPMEAFRTAEEQESVDEEAGDGKPAGQEQQVEQEQASDQQAEQEQQELKPAPTKESPPVQDGLGEVLRQQGELLQSLVHQTRQQPEIPKTQEQPEGPAFAFRVPPQIVQAMRSDDDAQFTAGLEALVSGVANSVWQKFTGEMTTFRGAMSEQVAQTVQSQHTAATERQSIYSDFYGKFKELDNPALRPVVTMVAKQFIDEAGPSFTWNAAFRDKLGETVKTLLSSLAPQQQQQTSRPNGPGNRFNSGGGSRPAASKPSVFDF